MKILSIDPGIARTGYAILQKTAHQTILHKSGCIQTNALKSVSARLLKIHWQLVGMIEKNGISKVVIEKLFFNTNQKTIVTVAQAQGVIMLAAAENNLDVEFLTPLQIKQALTGYGRADKQQVRKMVMILLQLKQMPQPDDVSDAIACGLAYLSTNRSL